MENICLKKVRSVWIGDFPKIKKLEDRRIWNDVTTLLLLWLERSTLNFNLLFFLSLQMLKYTRIKQIKQKECSKYLLS